MSDNWSSAALSSSLPAMDWTLKKPLSNEVWQSYCKFYQLPCSQEPYPKHYAGLLSIAGFHVVAQVWQPKSPAATAYLVHGLYDHVGLYHQLIKYCLGRGWRVVTFDLPGHGLSSGKRCAIESFQQYDQIFTKILTNICLHFSEPIHVFGQSTGGAIIANYLLKYNVNKVNSPFKSINLISPLVRPKGWLKIQLFLAVARLYKTHLERGISTNSHDLDFLEFVQTKDPLQTKKLAISWIEAVVDWNKFIEKRQPSDVEVNIVQGTDDYSVLWKYNLEFLKKKLPNSTIELIENARHHLVNETAEFQQPMWDFFNDRIV